jgi:hypothetical protein
LENEKRSENVLIMGLPEARADVGETDEEKCIEVFRAIGKGEIKPVEVARLGKPRENAKRAMKVKLSSKEDRDALLEKAAKLKEHRRYEKVFLKKDQHPLVAQELSRLYKVADAERKKDVNKGKNIVVDKLNRCVTVDGVVIDSFKPHFFVDRGTKQK